MADLNPRSGGRTVIRTLLIGGAVLFGLWALSPVVVISAGERGVKTTFGKPDEQVYEPGIHFKVPLAQAMHTMDVRLQKGEGEGDAAKLVFEFLPPEPGLPIAARLALLRRGGQGFVQLHGHGRECIRRDLVARGESGMGLHWPHQRQHLHL